MSNNKYKILIVEDEANIRSFIKTVLEANEYKVLTSDTCMQGQLVLDSHHPDLIILDLGLPDADGLEFIKYARKSSFTPIIVLSARSTEHDKVTALDTGANDYITKPFGTEELLARVRAALRNSRQGSASGLIPGGVFMAGDMKIDYDNRRVYIKDNEIRLTQTEYNIVALLSEHAGKILTYASKIKAVWGTSDSGSVKKLQVNMANIRKKLGSTPGNNQYIFNELGVGYRMHEENE